MRVELEYSNGRKALIEENDLLCFNMEGLKNILIDLHPNVTDLRNAAKFIRTIPADVNVNIYIFDQSRIVASVDYWGSNGDVETYAGEDVTMYNIDDEIVSEADAIYNAFLKIYNKELAKIYINMMLNLVSVERP